MQIVYCVVLFKTKKKKEKWEKEKEVHIINGQQ